MKKIVYTNEINNQIVSHEEHMLELYKEAIKEYIPLFWKNGYALKVGLMWKLFPQNATLFQRVKFQNGYQCYVYCVAQKDDKDALISSIDSEVDYYPLSTAWMVSSICRNFFKLNVSFCVSIDDVGTDLKKFLSHLKCIE